jgi:hypothetical protein
MTTDENGTKDPGSGKTSLQEVDEIEEVINLVDALSEGDGQLEEPQGESTSSGTEEGVIDLTDVVEESADGAPDDEQIVELVDWVTLLKSRICRPDRSAMRSCLILTSVLRSLKRIASWRMWALRLSRKALMQI